MNKYIDIKRNSLIKFVREQLIGPGACGEKFNYESENNGEVIDTTPGGIYCSSILFPKKSLSAMTTVEDSDTSEATTDFDATEGTQNTEEANTAVDTDKDLEEDIRELNQRFPNSFGLSCCLDSGITSDNDLEIIISGRYYRKINELSKVSVKVPPQDMDKVQNLLSKEILIGGNKYRVSEYFKLENDDALFYEHPQKKLYQDIKIMLDAFNKAFSSYIRSKDTYQYKPKDDVDIFLATYKDSLFDRYKNNKLDITVRDEAKRLIEEVEESERVLSYFYDLLPLIDSKGYGFWQAENFTHSINASFIDYSLNGKRKKLYKPGEEDSPGLQDFITYTFGKINKEDDGGQARLSSWIQLTKDVRDSKNDCVYLKIMIENTSDAVKETAKNQYSIVNESVNARCFFGVKIQLRSKHLKEYRSYIGDASSDAEALKLNYLYRKIEDYGIGHLCSVNWNPDEHSIWTEFMPECDVPDVDTKPQKVISEGSNLRLEDRIKDVRYLEFEVLSSLSQETDDDILAGLNQFVDAYKEWINEQTDSLYPTNAQIVREECESDYIRMKKNIAILTDKANMQAFRLMNTAMYMQLWHSSLDNRKSIQRKQRILKKSFYENIVATASFKPAWRSFQLAFILLNLDGIVRREDDPIWAARNEIVDLVWFPTGGGKTEAYLGIIAFCILHRRLNNKKSGGTTAIMRYTLRLLATQQFQRATRLILALESIRQWEGMDLGSDAINIGLYVGNDSLPNKEDDLKKEAEKWVEDKPSKIPLNRHECPWCGAQLKWNADDKKFACTNAFCYHKGLPVLLCDEHVYKTPPTLLFGTVDKFAQIAHKVSLTKVKEDSRRLFKHEGLTPDLIIQDELHLLSGPLGSAVGLFECAIDQLCSRTIKVNSKEIIVRPKIISSTATTRNTELQIRALYGRSVNVFPKSGVDYDDSFYAFYKRNLESSENPYLSKRKYIGILPTGRTGMYTQLRLASCCLAHRALFERDNYNELIANNKEFIKACDYYYSLVGYYNSIKDVGTTDSQFSTEFPKYTRQILTRVLRPEKMLHCYYSFNESFDNAELTGRLNGEEVVNSLSYVQERWDPSTRDVHINGETTVRGETPPDFILATNMISVGIDVSRFNTMIVNSMPRNKAEYIQATSRVARDDKGIVFTLHNPFRARDVSHFEQFKEFHEKLYYFVEPISITPFSHKAIETFLPLYLGTMVRHEFEELAENSSAKNINSDLCERIKRNTIKYFTNLAKSYSVLNGQLKEILKDEDVKFIEEYIGEALQVWLDKKDTLEAYNKHKNEIASLYTPIDSYEETRAESKWVVATSLRVIPQESVIKISNK